MSNPTFFERIEVNLTDGYDFIRFELSGLVALVLYGDY
jgi:hypothetical protein